jgi:hypothetical protein
MPSCMRFRLVGRTQACVLLGVFIQPAVGDGESFFIKDVLRYTFV